MHLLEYNDLISIFLFSHNFIEYEKKEYNWKKY